MSEPIIYPIDQPTTATDLPPVVHYPEILVLAENDVTEVIKSILHLTTKMSIGGGSKSKKTWLLIDLALSVAHGVPWLGFPTEQLKVLYINLEIPSVFFAKRLKAVSEIRNLQPIDPSKGHMLTVWSLRGYNQSYATLLPKILARIRNDGYGLIIIDPIYKLLGNADENKATDVTNMLNELERIPHETGAALIIAAHFSKGNQAKKESIDRISGSGAFGRDADTIMSMTEHEETGCYTCEFNMRSMPDVPPFVLQWTYPVMNRVDLDPAKLKQERGGRPAQHDQTEVLELLDMSGMTGADWQSECEQALGMSPSTFQRIRKELLKKGYVSKSGKKWSANFAL